MLRSVKFLSANRQTGRNSKIGVMYGLSTTRPELGITTDRAADHMGLNAFRPLSIARRFWPCNDDPSCFPMLDQALRLFCL